MPKDRRNPERQRLVTDGGRRATDPSLTTRDCADRLGVGTNFIIGEIHDGRLVAMVLERPGKKTIYRIAPVALEAYIRQHRWRFTPPAASASS